MIVFQAASGLGAQVNFLQVDRSLNRACRYEHPLDWFPRGMTLERLQSGFVIGAPGQAAASIRIADAILCQAEILQPDQGAVRSPFG